MPNAILTETLACFLPGQAKDLSAPLKMPNATLTETLACFLPGRAKDLTALLYIYIKYWKNLTITGPITQIYAPFNPRKAFKNYGANSMSFK